MIRLRTVLRGEQNGPRAAPVDSGLPVYGAIITLTAFAVSAGIIPPLITSIADEMGVNCAHLGYFIMLQYACFFIAGLSGGWLSEQFRIHSRVLVWVGLLAVSVVLTSGYAVKNLFWFTVFIIPLGLGGGLIESFGSVMISSYEKPNSSKLLNISQIFYCIGAITAPLIVSLFLYMGFPWRMIFVVFGFFVFMILCIFLFLTPRGTEAGCSVSADAKAKVPLLNDKLFYFLAATLFAYVTFESILAFWLPVYFEKGLSRSVSASAIGLSIFWVGLILGRGVITMLPGQYTLWPSMMIGGVMVCLCSLCASFIQNSFMVTGLVFCAGFGAGPLWPITVAVCRIARNRPQFTSSVIATGAVGVVLGSALGALIFRYMGFVWFFPCITFGTFVFLILSTFSYQQWQKEVREQRLIISPLSECHVKSRRKD